MSNPTTPFGWQMPTSTDLVTDLPADFEVFGQAVATSMGDLLGGTTGQVLSKASNTDMDFVWSADAAGMANPMTTNGDVIYSSPGSTPVRLGIGSTGQVLTVASGVPSWATPAASGGMTLISEVVANAATGVDFTSIPQTFKQLLLVWNGITHSAPGSEFALKLNNSSTSIYVDTGIRLKANVASQDQTLRDRMGISAFGINSNNTGQIYQGSGVLLIYNYASTTKTKTYQNNYYFFDNVNAENNNFSYVGKFNDTSAVTQINIFRRTGTDTISNVTNSTIRLYGIS